MLLQYVIKTRNGQADVPADAQILTERQPLHVINYGTAAKVGPGVKSFKQRRTCENNMQLGKIVVNVFQFTRSIRVPMNFVKIKGLAAMLVEIVSQIIQLVFAKPNIVKADIKH